MLLALIQKVKPSLSSTEKKPVIAAKETSRVLDDGTINKNWFSENENNVGSLRDNRVIFVKLREGKVHFVKSTGSLYFVDTLDVSVSDMIRNVFKGLKQVPEIKQCYLDQHSFFKGAFCIQLKQSQQDAVLVALRLQGIAVKMTKTAISEGV